MLRGRSGWRSGLRRLWTRHRWAAVGLGAVVAVVLGTVGAPGNFFDRLYTALQLFVLNYQPPPPEHPSVGVLLQIARFLAPAVAAYATIRAIAALFDDRLQELRAWFRRDHIVVCGLGGQGQELVENFLDEERFRNFLNQAVGVRRVLPVVAVEIDRANVSSRAARDAGANVLFGDATSVEILDRARIDRARYLFAVAGQDGVNAQIAAQALKLATGRKRPLEMFVHLDPRLCELVLSRPHTGAVVEFFSVYERAARTLLQEHPPFGDTDVSRAHVLVLGAGQLGSALVVRIAQEWEARPPQNGVRPRLRLVDNAAAAKAETLVGREPALEESCDFIPCEVDVESPRFERILASGELADVDVAYVCFDDDTRSLRTSLLLRQQLPTARVVTRMTAESGGLATLFAGEAYGRQAEVVPFSLVKIATRVAVALASRRGELARQIHRVYLGQGVPGPYSVPWEDLPDEIKESNLRQADRVTAHLQAAGFRVKPLDRMASELSFGPDDIETMAELEHESWLDEKVRQGWTYGAERNDAERLHPDVRPWDELSDDRKEINRTFVRSWPAVLRAAGIQITRA